MVRLVQRALGIPEQEFWNFAVLVRAYDVVHVLEALEQFRPTILCHATAYDDFHVGILLAQVLELADVDDGCFLGLFTHAAGVHDDDVGIFLVVRLNATAHVQLLRNHRGVVFVHLAAVCGQVVFFHAAKDSKSMQGERSAKSCFRIFEPKLRTPQASKGERRECNAKTAQGCKWWVLEFKSAGNAKMCYKIAKIPDLVA